MAKSTRTPPLRVTAAAKSKSQPKVKGRTTRLRAGSSASNSDEVDVAKLDVVWPRLKQPVNLRIDSDIIDWFREGGAGYQTRMNAVLRAFVDAHSKRR